MPEDVLDAFTDIIHEFAGLTTENAKLYLNELIKKKRLYMETW